MPASMSFRCLVPSLFFFFLLTSANAATLYVGPMEAYRTIQAGIDAAAQGDVVIVRDGTYTGPGNYNIELKGKVLTLKAETGPSKCIIDAQKQGRGFYIHSGETFMTVISGFKIINGAADYNGGRGIFCSSSPTIQNCIITKCAAGTDQYMKYAPGGGMTIINGNPKIISCNISENSTLGAGGGIYIYNAAPTIQGGTISSNSASSGGGIFADKSAPIIRQCTIAGNGPGPMQGGGIYLGFTTGGTKLNHCTITGNKAQVGAGIYAMSGPPKGAYIVNSIISGNTAQLEGGGVAFAAASEDTSNSVVAFIENSIISSNSSLGGGGGGGLLIPNPSEVRISSCTIDQNTAVTKGSAIAIQGSAPRILNSTFQGNKAKTAAGGTIFNQSESPYLHIVNSTFADTTDAWISGQSNVFARNCIFWGNSAGFKTPKTMLAITYSDVKGGLAKAGNIDADPRFVDAANGDFRLQGDSPCIDTGTNSVFGMKVTLDKGAKARPANQVLDMGAYEY